MAPKAKVKAKAKAKGAAKAKAKAKARLRPRLPRRGGLRRPAVAPAPPPVAAVTELKDLTIVQLSALKTILLEKAIYYGREVDVVGDVKELK